jgi:hypothetical protein
MLRETILQLSKAAEARKPALLVKIAAANPQVQVQSDMNTGEPIFADKPLDVKPDYLQMGKDYGPAVGYGAAGGALAGIPIALLGRALFSDDEEDADLPSYLMTALKGGLIGGGVGGLAGAGLRGAYGTDKGKEYMNKGLGYLPQSAQDFTKNVLG